MKYAMRRARIGEPKKAGELELSNLDLTRLMTGVETRITSLIRWASMVVIVLLATIVSYIWASTVQQHHDDIVQCRASNRSRAEIRQAFAGLYEKFVTATGGSQAAVSFRDQGNAELARGLPEHKC